MNLWKYIPVVKLGYCNYVLQCISLQIVSRAAAKLTCMQQNFCNPSSLHTIDKWNIESSLKDHLQDFHTYHMTRLVLYSHLTHWYDCNISWQLYNVMPTWLLENKCRIIIKVIPYQWLPIIKKLFYMEMDIEMNMVAICSRKKSSLQIIYIVMYSFTYLYSYVNSFGWTN